MWAAVLLDETTECVDLGSDRNPGHVIAGQWKRRLQRPRPRLRVEYLMKVLVDPMFGVPGDRMNLALTLNNRVLARRDQHPRLLDPFAWIGGFRRNAGHVALLLDRLGNVRDRFIV